MQELLFLSDSLEGYLSSGEYMAFVLSVLVAGCWLLCPWVLLRGSHRANRLRRLMDALPTSSVRGVFIGLVELKGTAECADPLVSFIAEKPCVWYSYTVEEHWRRVEVRTVVENGKRRTRTVVRSGWSTVAEGGRLTTFFLRDDTGEIAVHPQGADIEPMRVASFFSTPSDDAYYAKGPQRSIANSTFKRRFTEEAVPIGTRIYLVGPSRECRDRVAAEIASGQDGEEFIISTRDEEAIRRTKGVKAWCFAILGLGILAGGSYFLRSGIYGIDSADGSAWPLWIVAGGIYVLAWLVLWMWTVYNCLVDIRNRVRQGWAQVEVLLQRRYELIPSLCRVVEEYTRHESEAMFLVARLRRRQQLDHESINALQEAYPGLKAAPLYEQLMQELSDTELRIAMAREYYNTIATHLNTRLAVFPDGVIGNMFGVKCVNLVEGVFRDDSCVKGE